MKNNLTLYRKLNKYINLLWEWLIESNWLGYVNYHYINKWNISINSNQSNEYYSKAFQSNVRSNFKPFEIKINQVLLCTQYVISIAPKFLRFILLKSKIQVPSFSNFSPIRPTLNQRKGIQYGRSMMSQKKISRGLYSFCGGHST